MCGRSEPGEGYHWVTFAAQGTNFEVSWWWAGGGLGMDVWIVGARASDQREGRRDTKSSTGISSSPSPPPSTSSIHPSVDATTMTATPNRPSAHPTAHPRPPILHPERSESPNPKHDSRTQESPSPRVPISPYPHPTNARLRPYTPVISPFPAFSVCAIQSTFQDDTLPLGVRQATPSAGSFEPETRYLRRRLYERSLDSEYFTRKRQVGLRERGEELAQ